MHRLPETLTASSPLAQASMAACVYGQGGCLTHDRAIASFDQNAKPEGDT